MWAKTTFWTPFKKTDDATGSREEEDIERIKSSCSQASKRVNELRIRTYPLSLSGVVSNWSMSIKPLIDVATKLDKSKE